jgi:hypothetical protein
LTDVWAEKEKTAKRVEEELVQQEEVQKEKEKRK